MANRSVFLKGLSGPVSAGKMTLAHILNDIFAPHITLIFHRDDFCKEFNQVPTVNGHLDADGPAGVDFEKMGHVLDHVKGNG